MSMLREAGAAILSTADIGGYGSRRSPGRPAGNCHRSTPENHPFDIQPLLPAMTIEFGIEMLFHRPADAEIGDQRPALWQAEPPMNGFRLEDQDPPTPHPPGAGREPQGLYRSHD